MLCAGRHQCDASLTTILDSRPKLGHAGRQASGREEPKGGNLACKTQDDQAGYSAGYLAA